MSKTLEERLNDLEYLMTHTQQTIEDLDTVVRDRGSRVDALQREMTRLRDESRGLAGRVDALQPPSDEKPPHY